MCIVAALLQLLIELVTVLVVRYRSSMIRSFVHGRDLFIRDTF